MMEMVVDILKQEPHQKPMTGPKRNHHITPAFYLRGFACAEWEKESFILVYDVEGVPYSPGYMKTGVFNPCQHPVTRTGLERDYYAVEKPDDSGWDYETYENALMEIDNDALPAIQQLRKHELVKGEDRLALARYMTIMHKRVPRRRESAMDSWPEFIQSFEKESPTLRELDEWERNTSQSDTQTLEKIAEIRKAYFEHLEGYKAATTMPRRVLMDSMLVPSRLTQAFTEMAWRQLICDKDQFFLTSDHPLWFDERAGLAHERVDVTFPISSDAVLVLSRKPVSEGVFRAGRDIVAEVNHRSAAGSLRYMYGTRAEPWAAKL